MTSSRILIVLTSHKELGDTGKPTGFWLEEFAAPYYTFVDAGAAVTLASIQGGQPPIDPKSYGDDAQTETTLRYFADEQTKEALANTIPVNEADAGDYDAIFLPGGHGTMWDFPSSSALVNLIEAFDKEAKIIAAVCHAPAALVSVKAASGEPMVKGKAVTAFTDSEERGVELEEVVPFMLESRLRELGAIFDGGEDWASHVITAGHLITGQNPASSEPAAKTVLSLLSK